jgi:hypothetical protein
MVAEVREFADQGQRRLALRALVPCHQSDYSLRGLRSSKGLSEIRELVPHAASVRRNLVD